MGLIHNESATACRNKGYKVFCSDIYKFKLANKEIKYDIIVSFHCLEHLHNPKLFIRDLISLLTKEGSLYISTPYSPMDFELGWFDVLNHPPHHLGRWNISVYKVLAKLLGLNIEVFMPKPTPVYSSIIHSFYYSVYGYSINISTINFIKAALHFPLKLIFHTYKQMNRIKFNGQRTANVILVKLTKNNEI